MGRQRCLHCNERKGTGGLKETHEVVGKRAGGRNSCRISGLGVRASGGNLAPLTAGTRRAKKLGTAMGHCWSGCFYCLLPKLLFRNEF